jgi:small neutral amino acid transporter SnatA (MarC family)
MPLLLFVLAALCTVNAPRCRTAVPATSEATALAALGAAITAAAMAVFAIAADPLLDLVSISPSSFRLATGLLLVATGILAFGGPGPAPDPALPGRRAALVPICFPTLLTPGLAALTISGSVDHSAPCAFAVAAVALATLPALVSTGPESPVRRRVLDGVARLLAGGLVLVALGILFEGIFDI